MKIQSAFSPLTRVANLREITSIEEYETALAHELAVIFKHSKYCDLSHDAYQTVTRFCSAEPAATILLISRAEVSGGGCLCRKTNPCPARVASDTRDAQRRGVRPCFPWQDNCGPS